VAFGRSCESVEKVRDHFGGLKARRDGKDVQPPLGIRSREVEHDVAMGEGFATPAQPTAQRAGSPLFLELHLEEATRECRYCILEARAHPIQKDEGSAALDIGLDQGVHEARLPDACPSEDRNMKGPEGVREHQQVALTVARLATPA